MSMCVETFPGRAGGEGQKETNEEEVYCHSSTEREALPPPLAPGSESGRAESPAEAPGWQTPLSAAAEAPTI